MTADTPFSRSAPAIDCAALTRRFATATALDQVDVALPAGQFSVLLGPSGCGKSTLLRLIAGLDWPTEGRIRIGGRDVSGLPPVDRDLSMVFQSYALFPHLDVAQNILFGLSVRRVSKADQASRLDRVARMMGLESLLKRKPNELSGGQQQRVALARAVISERPICLMDEPLSNLDAKLRAEMRVELREIQQRLGLTVVYVTHDQVEAMTMADRIVVMNAGRIEQVGTPREIYATPASAFVARFIGTPPMNLVPLSDLSAAGAATLPGLGPRVVSGLAPDALAGLRPEDMTVGANGLPVRFVSEEYLGADRLVTVRAGASTLILRLAAAADALPESFHLTWPAGALHLFDAASGRRHSGSTPEPVQGEGSYVATS
ncbi:MAG: ABC transporter ATP-binding protein [Hoeflea sp.]|uniref:ABC transporter ATP-binding protein n=1 Tax=Hoeflea sp. TaxID=1940281 RepID=UPI002730D4E1|nr:ABC transporter ATP-binding protein [Hoeflea sp.]MDP2120918.1 ABC transporter ATP-binding protein [Hoeflea sp.]